MDIREFLDDMDRELTEQIKARQTRQINAVIVDNAVTVEDPLMYDRLQERIYALDADQIDELHHLLGLNYLP